MVASFPSVWMADHARVCRVLKVLIHDLKVGINIGDEIVGCLRVGASRSHLCDLLLLFWRQSVHVLLTRHVDVLRHILSGQDDDALNVVDDFALGSVGRAIDQRVLAERCLACVFARWQRPGSCTSEVSPPSVERLTVPPFCGCPIGLITRP